MNQAEANPNPFGPPDFVFEGEVAPDHFTNQPAISIFSPRNNSAYAVNKLSLSLNVSIGNSTTAASRYIWEITYKADWLPNNATIYKFVQVPQPTTLEGWRTYKPTPTITEFSTTLNLTEIPEGSRNVVVYALEKGTYERESGKNTFDWKIYTTNFNISGSSSVFFTVDTIRPTISLLSVENATYNMPDIPLSFIVSESASLMTYNLDGQEKVTLAGNTTLTDLSEGTHNVTVRAWDAAGNIGKSETVTFTVDLPEAFAAVFVAAASGVSVALIGFSLLFYLNKKRASRD